MTREQSNLVALGFATTLAQVVLLREAMAAMAGSELAWGTVLALWLFGMGIGSRLGVRAQLGALAHAAPSVCVLVAAAGIILFRAGPTLAGVAAGEQLPLWHSSWIWVLAILPSAVLGGLAFPALADRHGDAGRAYAMESIGAALGGLAFSFLLAPLGTTAGLGMAAGLSLCIWLWPSTRAAAVLGMTAAIAVGLCSAELLASASWRWANRPGDLGNWQETRHQRIEVSEGKPASLFLDGSLVATYPELYSTPLRIHLLMLLHPSPNRVLVVGGLADGSLTHVLSHPVEEVIVVEDDPAMLRLLPRWFDQDFRDAMADSRVVSLAADPLRALAQTGEVDMILLLDGDPTTVRRNRTRSREFINACADRLADGGLLVMRTSVSDTYLGGAAGRLLAILRATVSDAFPRVEAIPGEGILLIGGSEDRQLSLDPAELSRRWQLREIDDPLFQPELLPVLLDSGRARTLADFLDLEKAPPNSSLKPTAVLLAAALREGRGAPAIVRAARAIEGTRPPLLWMLLAAAVGAITALGRMPRAAAPSVALIVGAASMCWWLSLLFCWQARFGSVFAEVGALTGVFMGGIAAGASAASRADNATKKLPLVLAGSIMISVAIAAGMPVFAPLVTVPTLLFCGGCATGAAFPGLSGLMGGRSGRRGAGVAFAYDEIGAAAAAILVGVIILPKLGVQATAAGLAALQAAALVTAARAREGL